MTSKAEIVKKIVMSRRFLTLPNLMEETKMDSVGLLDLQKMYLQLLNQLLQLQTVKISSEPKRLTWKNERNQFWETDCQLADEHVFKNNFRMGRRSFYKLCQLLPGLLKNDTKICKVIPLEKRVAIALYTLGSSAEYRTIANIFGVGKASVRKILLGFCDEVWRVLSPLYLKNFPLTKEKIEDLVQEFEVLGFPQCMGALGGCHIGIHTFNDNATDYYNSNGWYSVAMLALADARHRFIYVSCGSPGRYNDSEIFQNSSLKQQLDQCSLLTDLKKVISGVDVPVFIIGDSAFQLSDKLMKPYPLQMFHSDQQKHFNYALAKSQRVVKDAFGQLKARFSRIGKVLDTLKNTNTMVMSCCVLHNFLKENNDAVNEMWLEALKTAGGKLSYPKQNTSQRDLRNNTETIRQAITTYLSVDDGESVVSSDGEPTEIEEDVSSVNTSIVGIVEDMDDDNSCESMEFISLK